MLLRFIKNVFLGIGFLLVYSCAEDQLDFTAENKFNAEDSIVSLIEIGKRSPDSISYLHRAIKMSETIGADSLWFAALDHRSIQFYRHKNYSSFYSDAKKYYNRALEVEDTRRKAKGAFKLGSYYLKSNLLDSAFFFFYQASKDYQLQSDSVQAASNLLNMAIIQNYTRDFFGSEQTSIEALSLLKNSPQPVKLLLGIYNNLGIVTRNLDRYPESVKWYKKSLTLAGKLRERMVILNNIGVSYKYQGLYQNAVERFEKALALDSSNKNMLVQASILDNMGHGLLLDQKKATADIYQILNKACLIRTKHSNPLGLFESKLHLSDYFLLANDSIKALELAKQALAIAQNNAVASNERRALELLSKISNNLKWSRALIVKMDEIVKSEMTYKQQFASILYESERREEENHELQNINNLQKKNLKTAKKWGAISIGIIGVIAVLLILVFRNYRQKQKLHKKEIIIEKLKAKSEEKHLLSMHLHDDISTDLLVGLQQAEELLEPEGDAAWSEILDLFEQSYEKLRVISQDINVTSFQSIAFEKKINNLIRLYSFKNGLSISTKGLDEIDWSEIAVDLKVEAYMILKEALNNIIKHAGATEAILWFSIYDSKLMVTIKDDGSGFKQSESLGVGLMNIQSRIERVEGKLQIKTNSKGTSLFIELPKL